MPDPAHVVVHIHPIDDIVAGATTCRYAYAATPSMSAFGVHVLRAHSRSDDVAPGDLGVGVFGRVGDSGGDAEDLDPSLCRSLNDEIGRRSPGSVACSMSRSHISTMSRSRSLSLLTDRRRLQVRVGNAVGVDPLRWQHRRRSRGDRAGPSTARRGRTSCARLRVLRGSRCHFRGQHRPERPIRTSAPAGRRGCVRR